MFSRPFLRLLVIKPVPKFYPRGQSVNIWVLSFYLLVITSHLSKLILFLIWDILNHYRYLTVMLCFLLSLLYLNWSPYLLICWWLLFTQADLKNELACKLAQIAVSIYCVVNSTLQSESLALWNIYSCAYCCAVRRQILILMICRSMSSVLHVVQLVVVCLDIISRMQ